MIRSRIDVPDTVLVITGPDDDTGDRVVLELQRLGAPFVRFDLADFPTSVELDATLDEFGSWQGLITVRGRRINLADIHSVLWWHPNLPSGRDMGAASEGESLWLARESTAALNVLCALDCKQVSHPRDTRSSQVKADVLMQAVRAGLTVPPTWIGTQPTAARIFGDCAPAGIVTKTLTTPQILLGGDRVRMLYTAPVDPQALDRAAVLGPCQLQHRIDTQYAVRAHVIGPEVIAVRIDARSPAAHQDWRADYDALSYSPTALPDEVTDGLLALTEHYGLVYAAIDLLVDSEGTIWFVDLNPAGQYGWIEQALPEIDITRKLARFLTGRTQRPPSPLLAYAS